MQPTQNPDNQLNNSGPGYPQAVANQMPASPLNPQPTQTSGPYAAPNNPAPQPVQPYYSPSNTPPYTASQAAPNQPAPGQTYYQPQPPATSAGQLSPQPPAHDPSRYDFFLNPDKPAPAKPSLLPTPSGGGLGIGKILLMVGFVFAVLAIAAVVISATRSSGGPPPVLSTIATDQQEIIHITNTADTTLGATSLKNFSVTAATTTTSAQQQYLAYLKKRGVTIDAKKLSLQPFPQVDQVLTAAQTAGTYDDTFKSTMQTILTDYLNKLQQAAHTSTSKNESDILAKNFTAATLLQTQLNEQ